jgi:hypothetical protein
LAKAVSRQHLHAVVDQLPQERNGGTIMFTSIYETPATHLYREMVGERQDNVEALTKMIIEGENFNDDEALTYSVRIRLLTEYIDEIEANEKAANATTSDD